MTTKCIKCGKPATDIHHKDENHKNNKPSNLQNLCVLCHAKIHSISPKKSELKRLVDFRDRRIQIRNAITNQIRSLSRIEYIIEDFDKEKLEEFNKSIKELEKAIKGQIEEDHSLSENHKTSAFSVWPWLKEIKGISHITAAKLISHIDIENTPTVSALWRYCGLDATHIKRTKKISQEEAKKFGKPYLKKELLGVLADNFIKQRTPKYRDIYDKEKKKQMELLEKTTDKLKSTLNVSSQKETGEKAKDTVKPIFALSSPPVSLGHAHKRARRKMIKEFVKDLFVEWKKLCQIIKK